jgi:hypothetical protein
MSLFMFLLITEGLSRLIKNAIHQGIIKGIKISQYFFIMHLLFVDDIILFGESTVKKWETIKYIMNLFFVVT